METSVVLFSPLRFLHIEKDCSANSVINWLVQNAMDLNVPFNNFRKKHQMHMKTYTSFDIQKQALILLHTRTRFLQTLPIVSSRLSGPGVWCTSYIDRYNGLPAIVRIMSWFTTFPSFQIQHECYVSSLFHCTPNSGNTRKISVSHPALLMFWSTLDPRFMLAIGNSLCILCHSVKLHKQILFWCLFWNGGFKHISRREIISSDSSWVLFVYQDSLEIHLR